MWNPGCPTYHFYKKKDFLVTQEKKLGARGHLGSINRNNNKQLIFSLVFNDWHSLTCNWVWIAWWYCLFFRICVHLCGICADSMRWPGNEKQNNIKLWASQTFFITTLSHITIHLKDKHLNYKKREDKAWNTATYTNKTLRKIKRQRQ